MHLWLIKDIQFGYQYTSNKIYRKLIYDYFDYVYKILSSKGNKDDYFIICGGLFSNTNPTIVAINDAIKNIRRISELMNVYIIDTKKDNRKYDNEFFSTIDILHDIDNVTLIKNKSNIGDLYLLPTNITNTENKAIITDDSTLKLDNIVVNIPSAIQFNESIENIGLLVYDVVKNKHISLKNNVLPKHTKKDINTFEELNDIDCESFDHIHLVIDFKLKQENETKLNILLSKINPNTVRFKNEIISKKNTQLIDVSEINIIDIIKTNINDDAVNEQFERILKINSKI